MSPKNDKSSRQDSVDLFEETLNDLRVDPDFEAAKWFGIPAIKYSGKVIAALYRDELVVKLGEERANHFVENGEGELFDPSEKGKPMREWVVLIGMSTGWVKFVDEAKVFHLDGV